MAADAPNMRFGPLNRTAAAVPALGRTIPMKSVPGQRQQIFTGTSTPFSFGPAPETIMGSHIANQQTAFVGLCRGGGGHGPACCCAQNLKLDVKAGERGDQAQARAQDGWLESAPTPVGRENFRLGAPDTQVAVQALWVYLSLPGPSRSASCWLWPAFRHSPKVLDAREI